MATSRLLTLTGPGGIGKTRLALQVSATIQDERLSDVILVDLADVVDSERVAQTIASALGVPEEVSKPVQAALLGRLESRELVLVLDNCEHLLSACAALAGVLLQSCPMLRILVTSREPIRIGGETLWRVPSLALPVGGLPVDVAGAEAVQLFVERARAIVAGFAVTDHNAWAVAQVCRRLDGIPLAIELAAAWVHVLSVEQIADRLSAALQLLVGGSRLAPERQQTLRATVDWSYGLLSDREQRVFERLSVCAGGWTLEAAESICAGDGIEPTAVLELLARLVNASLLYGGAWHVRCETQKLATKISVDARNGSLLLATPLTRALADLTRAGGG